MRDLTKPPQSLRISFKDDLSMLSPPHCIRLSKLCYPRQLTVMKWCPSHVVLYLYDHGADTWLISFLSDTKLSFTLFIIEGDVCDSQDIIITLYMVSFITIARVKRKIFGESRSKLFVHVRRKLFEYHQQKFRTLLAWNHFRLIWTRCKNIQII